MSVNTRWRVALIAAALLSTFAAGVVQAKPVAPAPGIPAPLTVIYCNDQKMDIYEPASLKSPAPAVMWVHGGGLVKGNREGGGFLKPLVAPLLAKGFVVASIDYRLAPANKWPAPIEDTTCAVRFLRAHAATYHIDPARIGAWGGSAGGLLVNLLGTIDPPSGFDNGAYSDQSSRVQAVVDLFGPADLTRPLLGSEAKRQERIAALLPPGTPPSSPAAARLPTDGSPVHWVSSDDPPFLILQGDQDTTVPPEQSEEFYQRLHAAGVSAQLVMVKGGRHGLQQPNEQPSKEQIVSMIVNFFVARLHPGTTVATPAAGGLAHRWF